MDGPIPTHIQAAVTGLSGLKMKLVEVYTEGDLGGIRGGVKDRYGQNILYTCMKLPRNE